MDERRGRQVTQTRARAADEPKRLTMDDVTRLIMQLAQRRKRFIPEALARDISELVVQTALTQTIETGSFKFRNGWGSLRLKLLHTKPTIRKMPHGQVVDTKARGMIQYKEGSAVRDLLGIERRPADYKTDTPEKGRPRQIIKNGSLLPDA